MSKNIYITYYRGYNLGDELNPYIVSSLISDELKLHTKDIHLIHGSKLTRLIRLLKRLITNNQSYSVAAPWQKPFFCIGSILRYASTDTIVWGSGFMNNYEKTKASKFYAVRGPLSARNLGLEDKIAYGDPALLLPLLYNTTKEKKYDIGIIPHYLEYDKVSELYSPRYKIINVISKAPLSVVDQILSCKFILSSSLHGIIIAHAYGIPAIWVKFGDIGTDGFKFEDYFMSVGIEPYQGHSTFESILNKQCDLQSFIETNKTIVIPEMKKIQMIQKSLLRVY